MPLARIGRYTMTAFVEVRNLKKYFPVQKGLLETILARKIEYVRAVDDISFEVERGEIFGLAGESGSGKTTTGRLILRLVEPTEGKVLFDKVNLFSLKKEELRNFRRHMQIIFQDPTASLNPRMKVGDAVRHPLEIYGVASREEGKKKVLEVLERVGLSPAEGFYEKYPHQLSGGQRQRVVIGRALILNPEFIVADEPVAMIDVSLRAQIMDLMISLRDEFNLTFLYITHDLATAKYICNKIAIMYLGKIVEMGFKDDIFDTPMHPYSLSLLSAIPVPNPRLKPQRIIPKGEIPSPINPPSGCRFHPRCLVATEECSQEEPKLHRISPNHYVACHHLGEIIKQK